MNKDEEITVLLIEPEKVPKEITITNSLESLQNAVGGYIEVLYPFDDNVCIICNEEGKLNGMQLNRALHTMDGEIYDILAGPVIIAGLTEDDFGSLTAEQAELYSKMYHTPEAFIMNDGKITVFPIRAERELDSFEIYQINRNLPDSMNISFLPYDELGKKGKDVNKANYSQVYSGNYAGETLDAIYERFNLHHPSDFRGHSLSVSDVIVLHQDGVDTAYYVDSFGFKQVPEFFAANPLEKIEELLEDDYGMIDGVINNGSRKDDEILKKPSVLEKLEEKKQEAALIQQNTIKPVKDKSKDIDLYIE